MGASSLLVGSPPTSRTDTGAVTRRRLPVHALLIIKRPGSCCSPKPRELSPVK